MRPRLLDTKPDPAAAACATQGLTVYSLEPASSFGKSPGCWPGSRNLIHSSIPFSTKSYLSLHIPPYSIASFLEFETYMGSSLN